MRRRLIGPRWRYLNCKCYIPYRKFISNFCWTWIDMDVWIDNYSVFKIFRWLQHSNYCVKLHRCQQTLTMHLLTGASYKILVKTTGFILIRDGTTFWQIMQVMLCFDLYSLGAVLFQLSSTPVSGRRVTSHRLHLGSSLPTTHAAHPSPANHYNDSTQWSKKTTITSHIPRGNVANTYQSFHA